MTNENELEGQSRRRFLKTTGAVGVAATTGVAAFGGSASAQGNLDVDITDVNLQEGLININVEDVDLTLIDVEDINVTIQNITIQNIDILSNNVIQVDVDVEDVLNNNVIVAVVRILSDGRTLVGVDRQQL